MVRPRPDAIEAALRGLGHRRCAAGQLGSPPNGVGGYEIHETVAAQVLAARHEFETQAGFGIPDERLNLNGGAVALGHPSGGSGTRGELTVALELVER